MKKFPNPLWFVVALFVLVVGYLWMGDRLSIAERLLSGSAQDNKFLKQDLPVLRVLLWKGYISEEIHRRMEKDLNFRIEAFEFDSELEFADLMKLYSESGIGEQFDVIMPSDFMVPYLRDQKLIEKLDYREIPNTRYIAGQYARMEQVQEIIDYSVPYIYGAMGIGYNIWEMGNLLLSWRDLFEPEYRPSLRGRIGISPDARVTLGMILATLGKSPNSREREEIELAAEYLKEAIKRYEMRMLTSGGARLLVEQDLVMVMAWGGEVAAAMHRKSYATDEEHLKANKLLRYSLPNEGSLAYFEALAVSSSSNKKGLALQYINLLLDPKISAAVTNYSFSATVNVLTAPLIPPEIIKGPAYYVPVKGNAIFLKYLDEDESIYKEVWREVMAVYDQVHASAVDSNNRNLLWRF